MKRDGFTAVDSSHISGVKYDSFERRMTVKFRNGAVYHVHSVMPDEYEALMSAPSQGAHYHAHIKNRFFVEQIK